MTREDLLKKGYTEEQVTDLLNMFHNENLQTTKENEKLKGDLVSANERIAGYSNMEKEYTDYKKSLMTEQEKFEAMKKEAEINLAKSNRILNEAQAKTILATLGENVISDDLLSSIVSEDNAKTIANANALVSMIKARDEATVKKTREDIQNTNVLPAPSNVPNGEKVIKTFEDFDKLSYEEQIKFQQEHPEEFENL